MPARQALYHLVRSRPRSRSRRSRQSSFGEIQALRKRLESTPAALGRPFRVRNELRWFLVFCNGESRHPLAPGAPDCVAVVTQPK